MWEAKCPVKDVLMRPASSLSAESLGTNGRTLRTNFFRRAPSEFQGSEMLATIFSWAMPITSFYNGTSATLDNAQFCSRIRTNVPALISLFN